MQVLITGITGMIGSHLAKELSGAGYEVAGISRATSAARFARLNSTYKHYLGDILDRPFLERVWQDWQPKIVFHLAAQAYNGASWDAEDTTYALNIRGRATSWMPAADFLPKPGLSPLVPAPNTESSPRACFPLMRTRPRCIRSPHTACPRRPWR